MEIRSKRQFFELWKLGVLGNRTELWDTVEEALASGCPKIGFREIGKTGGGAWTLVDRKDAQEISDEWKSKGRRFIMDNSVPNNRSVLQGEICRTYKGLESYLAVGYGLEPMRKTMAAGLHRHRGYAETNWLLKKYLDPASRDDLDALLELYPDAAIELTCFDVNVGNIPGRNTMFWEVRNY